MLEDLWIICPPNSELDALSGLEKLTKLTVCRSGIKDISFVSGMKRLTDLNLSENEIADLTPLYGLERLADLSISDNPLTVEQVEELRAKLPGCNVRFRIDD
jgi:Leucine-rich repeat (LRR) protein